MTSGKRGTFYIYNVYGAVFSMLENVHNLFTVCSCFIHNWCGKIGVAEQGRNG